MKNLTKINIAKVFRYTARILLVLASAFWFVFALLSGAEEAGGGFMGIVKNSPNALPWLVLFVFVYISFKMELLGGIVIAILGILTVFAFDTFDSAITFFVISFPFILLGGLLIASWYLSRK